MQKIGFCDKYSLTQAVLNSTKTMTRRLEKGLETFEFDYEVHFVHSMEIINQYWDEEKNSLVIITPQGKMKVPTRYKLGEVVAVAQSYKDVWDIQPALLLRVGVQVGDLMKSKAWTNKLFVTPKAMPHQIQITGIKIEHIQDITDEDCLKEGILKKSDFPYKKALPYYFEGGKHEWDNSFRTPRQAFASLIDRPGVGRKGLWEFNPWVVVYEFKLIK
jgi:hypothetical protein